MTTVMRAEALKKHYQVDQGFRQPQAIVKALDGVSFDLQIGKTLAVVGESGCGKSTLAKLLTSIETPTAGTLEFDGKNLLENVSKAAAKERRQKIQIIFQNPYGSLNPRKKIGYILEEPLIINTDMSKADRRARALDMLQKVGLRPEHYNRYPHMFSGGQRQRIAIARGLMMNPQILIADEPVSALDVSVQAQVLNLMMDLQQELNLAYVFISHDLSIVEHIADTVMVMYLGKVVEYGNKQDIFANPRHPYTRALLSSTPRIKKEHRIERIRLTGELPSPLNPPSGCSFHGRCQYANETCKTKVPELIMHDQSQIACHAVEEGRI
ncbi:peptide ABC transporter ATP-binding protein [Gynuella sp.]|uniref:peptide ABC transporter ATP-binding protein n=1 Tax=Gynuella sp. TaxID=2969146 RepID=UPI003D0CA698